MGFIPFLASSWKMVTKNGVWGTLFSDNLIWLNLNSLQKHAKTKYITHYVYIQAGYCIPIFRQFR